ncbi:hypothetical protein [Halobaculum lipolyticum]|uniref:Zinc ribbon domain-containing protein n=1 Tax=Halobaculum lipolyticum TaxID=3032001 RepID=A0ABD5WAF0_9EURY|nr:hypothetical protein [Halobaculum sp. DT31]
MTTTTDEAEAEELPTPGPDEKFCGDCGEVIKQRAEICPECGVRQHGDHGDGRAHGGVALSDEREYELRKAADKEELTVALVGFLLSPLAYWMVGKKGLAAVNLLTLNYFFLGPIVVPIHCYMIVESAEDELERAGVPGY